MSVKLNLQSMTIMIIPFLIGVIILSMHLIEMNLAYLLIGVSLLIVVPLFLAKYKINFLLFTLFALFGVMNLPIKPFDLMFVGMYLVMLLLQRSPLQPFAQFKLVHLSMFFFALVSLLSTLSSHHMKEGFSYFIHTIFVMIIFYFIVQFTNEEKRFKSILWGYTISAFLSALLIIIEFLGIYTGFYTLFQGVRAKGLFYDPNDFAPYLMLAILFLFHQYTTKSLKSFQCYLYLFGSLGLTAILLSSLSRAAILNLIVTLCIFFLFNSLSHRSFKHIGMYFTSIIIGVSALFIFKRDSILNWLTTRFYATEGVIQSYDTDRFFYQRQGLELGSTNILGIGPGQFELLMNYATHNLYIRIIAENGWFAFLFFSITLLIILVQLIKYWNRMVWGLPVYMYLAGYVGLLINSFFLDTLHWRYFWFYLGLCVVLLMNVKKGSGTLVLSKNAFNKI